MVFHLIPNERLSITDDLAWHLSWRHGAVGAREAISFLHTFYSPISLHLLYHLTLSLCYITL